MMSMACFFLAATIVLFVDGFEVKGIRLTSRIMLYLTGYIMRPAAATLWMVVVLYLVMKYQVKALLWSVCLSWPAGLPGSWRWRNLLLMRR